MIDVDSSSERSKEQRCNALKESSTPRREIYRQRGDPDLAHISNVNVNLTVRSCSNSDDDDDDAE
jgi:hypothetical protein